jgi:uncharacterized protein YecE (DUF72 family)
MEKLEDAAELAGERKIERPYSLPGILLGTSAFTANGWQGSFYPPGMKPRDFLPYYATQFATVEVDSTFYGCPSVEVFKSLVKQHQSPENFCIHNNHYVGHGPATAKLFWDLWNKKQ